MGLGAKGMLKVKAAAEKAEAAGRRARWEEDGVPMSKYARVHAAQRATGPTPMK